MNPTSPVWPCRCSTRWAGAAAGRIGQHLVHVEGDDVVVDVRVGRVAPRGPRLAAPGRCFICCPALPQEPPNMPQSATTNRRLVLAASPKGEPTADTFRLETLPVPTPGPGQMLLRTLWLSLDPYMRGRMNANAGYAEPVAIGGLMVGQTISRVTASNHPDYVVGDRVVADAGARHRARQGRRQGRDEWCRGRARREADVAQDLRPIAVSETNVLKPQHGRTSSSCPR